MTYWLCITNEENWEVVKQRAVWGVAERHLNTIAKAKKGDMLVMYLKKEKIGEKLRESRISGIFEATSDVFRDSTHIFGVPKGMGAESFPLRIKLKPVKIFEKPLEFKPLIPKLSFITNKKWWSAAYLRGKAMREIPRADFEVITAGV